MHTASSSVVNARARARNPLCMVPAGDNRLADLRAVSYLVRFMRLQLLTLAGNPLAGDHDYRSYVLSHLKHLAYLDYRCACAVRA
jgi:hypothetical protein